MIVQWGWIGDIYIYVDREREININDNELLVPGKIIEPPQETWFFLWHMVTYGGFLQIVPSTNPLNLMIWQYHRVVAWQYFGPECSYTDVSRMSYNLETQFARWCPTNWRKFVSFWWILRDVEWPQVVFILSHSGDPRECLKKGTEEWHSSYHLVNIQKAIEHGHL